MHETALEGKRSSAWRYAIQPVKINFIKSFTSTVIKDIFKKLNIDDNETVLYYPNPNQ